MSEERLRTFLDKDIASGIPSGKNGKINRNHYARQLGCYRASLKKFNNVFAEYEFTLLISRRETGPILAMREWLHAAYDSKSLGFSAGKVDRKDFAKRFDLRANYFMVRYPEIREIFEDLDDRAIRENYLPVAAQLKFDRLEAALEGGPPLSKDRLKINQIALAKALGVTVNSFRDKASSDAITRKNIEIFRAASESKIDPLFHGRVYVFSDLSLVWPKPFLERIGIEFKNGFSGRAAISTIAVYLEIYHALEFIGASELPQSRRVVQETFIKTRIDRNDDWEDALYEYRDHIIVRANIGETGAGAADEHISCLRRVLSIFSTSRLVPETSVPLPGLRLARRHRGHLRSVAEAGTQTKRDSKTYYVEFARAQFREVCKAHDNIIDAGESINFFNALIFEIDRAEDLPKNASSAIRLLLERRLSALQNAAIRIVRLGKTKYDRGQELLLTASIDGERFENDYFGKPMRSKERVQIMRELFPDTRTASVDEANQGLANFLMLIEQRHFGIPPRCGVSKVGPFGHFFARRYLECGGIGNITPMLTPAPEVVGASLTLYLIEAGANVSVGRTLDEDCLEASDLADHFRITGSKARAKGKPIIVDLPKHSPAVEAIQWLRSASGRLRACAGDDRDRLFLMRIGARVQLMTPDWYTTWFKTFASETPSLQGLGLTPNMLRPSVLLHAALSNDGRLAVGMAVAQHGLAVSQGYQNKFPTRLLYDENVQRFHAAFETLVMANIEDAADKLGITAEQFEARLGDLRSTGLGTFCRDQRGRPGQGTSKCSTMDCWNDCPNLIIVAEVEAIASLQIWQSSLRAALPVWERDRPERWNEVWLPWLCLTDVVAEKMVRGPLIKVWKAAIDLAAQMSLRPSFVPPQPW